MKIGVFDIEANGFLEDVDDVFCIAVYDLDSKNMKLFEPNKIQEGVEYLKSFDALVAHNGLGYDFPVLRKLFNFHYDGKIYDTLILSRLRYAFFRSHSLESWGERFKYPKISYHNFNYYEPEMGEYCERDVEITVRAFNHLRKQIDIDQDYVALEHDILSIQTDSEQYGVTFDYEGAMKLSMKIDGEMKSIQEQVEEALGYSWSIKEHKLKRDGSISHHATNLISRLETDFPEFEHIPVVSEETSLINIPTKITLDTKKLLTERLLELGWKPTMHTEKGSPQITRQGSVCPNLPEDFKGVGKYFVLKHRKALIDGFFKNVRKDGKIPSEANTLGAVTGRYTHRKIANFPAVRSLYGEEIRALFGVDKGRVQVGCDLAGIEARMLAHYMEDEEYTEEVLNGDIHSTNQHAAGLPTRDSAKTFFYGFLYGAGDAKVGLLVNGDSTDGKRVKEQFLDSLPALKQLIETKQKEAKKGHITSLDGRPIYITKSTGFNGKPQYDTRKALNSLLQSSATIFFKRWLWFIEDYVKQNNIDAKLMISYHDEVQYSVAEKDVDQFKNILRTALKSTDIYYETKCPNDIDIKTGKDWMECH